MQMAITTNEAQQIFVISTGHGYSCFGFDNCFQHLKQLNALLGRPAPKESDIGTLPQYRDYLEAVRIYSQHSDINRRTYFDPLTPRAATAAIESCITSGKNVRLFLGDPETGRVWDEENDVYGHISRSTGPLRVPILVAPRQHAGGAILTANVLAILAAVPGQRPRKLYEARRIVWPTYRIGESTSPGYAAAVFRLPDASGEKGGLVAQFKKREQADRWAGFMMGNHVAP